MKQTFGIAAEGFETSKIDFNNAKRFGPVTICPIAGASFKNNAPDVAQDLSAAPGAPVFTA